MILSNRWIIRCFSQIQKVTVSPIDHSLFKEYDKKIVVVKNCPANWREPHLQKYFDRYLNTIDNLVLGKNNLNDSNGRAFLFFKDSITASNFVDRYHNDFINTEDYVEHLNVSLYTPKTKDSKLRVLRENRQVEVYNLPFEATNMDILSLMVDQDQVEDFQMPMRSLNKNKGYALITFKNNDTAADFLQNIQGLTLFGREIKGRAKFIKFDTQKPRKGRKSDFIIEQAETEEIKIQGAMDRYVKELFEINKLI